MSYLEMLANQFWHYHSKTFPEQADLFDRSRRDKLNESRPPVFTKAAAIHNVLVDGTLDRNGRNVVLTAIPVWERHRWFRSMRSSQALAQSVFGNLKAKRMSSVLHSVESEEGTRPFDFGDEEPSLELEKVAHDLGEAEGHETKVDVYMKSGRRRLAIECKLTEATVGCCSRPKLDEADPYYCIGNYQRQANRIANCSLTEVGILYWKFIPQVFLWNVETDHRPCPLRITYQLVRNVLAASVAGDCTDCDQAGAVLLYDSRNPEFSSGAGFEAYRQTRAALRVPRQLCRVTWQNVVACMRHYPSLDSLTQQLDLKYGL